MKKLFSAILAAAMAVSLASASFATVTETYGDESDIVLSYFAKYDSDTDEALDVSTPGNHAEYGNKYYAIIFEGRAFSIISDKLADDGLKAQQAGYLYNPISNFDQIEKLKIKTKFEQGEELVKSIKIVKKKITAAADSADLTALPDRLGVSDVSAFYVSGPASPAPEGWNNTGKNIQIPGTNATYDLYTRPIEGVPTGWYYFVEIETYPRRDTGDSDIIGTFTFNRKSNSKKNISKIDDVEQDFFLNLWYEYNYNDFRTELYDIDDSVELKWDDLYVLKFNCDEEVEVEFGTEPNEGTFTVDVSGQGKLVIDFSTEPNEAIAAANEGVKMDFVNFNGAKFNRVGVFEYEMDGLAAAYQIIDGKLAEIKGLEIDGDTATFNTSRLGNYVFATAELVNPA